MAHTDENPRRLVSSSVAGRFSLDQEDGPDLYTNTRIALVFGSIEIIGEVQHASKGYVCQGGEVGGYYFLADNGQVFGLRIGMLVRRIE